jgi:hypothetical protein
MVLAVSGVGGFEGAPGPGISPPRATVVKRMVSTQVNGNDLILIVFYDLLWREESQKSNFSLLLSFARGRA